MNTFYTQTFRTIPSIIFQQSYLDTNLSPNYSHYKKNNNNNWQVPRNQFHTCLGKWINPVAHPLIYHFHRRTAFKSIRTTCTQRHLFAIRNRYADIIELNTYIYIYTHIYRRQEPRSSSTDDLFTTIRFHVSSILSRLVKAPQEQPRLNDV